MTDWILLWQHDFKHFLIFTPMFMKRSRILIKAWQVLSNLTGARSWVRKSEGILAKMTGKSDDFMDKVKSYYSNHQKPAGMGTPPFVHQGTPFDEFGHPNFVPEVPAIGSHGKIKYQPDAT